MANKSKNTILVPLDFSDISTHALNHAIQVAKQFDNNLALLHVVEESLLSSILSFGKNEHLEELAREAAKSRLETIAADIKAKHNITCSTAVKFGRIHKQIVEMADECGCDSIMMGSHGASGFDQIIGSNASRVIGHSNVPVVVVKSEQPINSYKNIVFPLDLTAESKQKVNWAIHLGKAYKSTIHILTEKTGDSEWDKKLAASLNQIEHLLAKEGVHYTHTMKEHTKENFAMETINYSEEIHADLIMIMTQQEDKNFSEYIIGSYAQQIVNHSRKVPVMCIKPKATGVAEWRI